MGTSFGNSYTTALLTILLLPIVRWIYLAIYNITYHPLAKFPGPKLYAISHLPSLWDLVSGKSVPRTFALHRRYGTVVRIGPDELSFSTAQAWKDIYGFRKNGQIPKDWKRFPDVPNPIPILAANDADHARIRKLMAHSFSDIALREQEPLLMDHLYRMLGKLDHNLDQKTQSTLDMNKWLTLVAWDIITDLSFGESLSSLKSDEVDPTIVDFEKTSRMFPVIPISNSYSILRFLFHVMMRTPKFRKEMETGFALTKEKVKKRITNASPDRRDFMTYILRHNDERGMSEDEIIGSTSILVAAGGDSVASSTTATIYNLLANPKKLQKAQLEVRNAFTSRDQITLASTSNLPYLAATVEEALRMKPPVAGIFARRTASTSQLIDGVVVPPHTSLGVHQYSSNHSPEQFHNPDEYVPERWLRDPPTEYQNDNLAASQPWSIGPRNCIGKNLAYLEIRATIAHLLWGYEMKLNPQSQDWPAKQIFDVNWARQPLLVDMEKRKGT